MRAFIVYCHPSDSSFTHEIFSAFTKGLADAGHDYIVSDLYKMNFRTDMTEEEYLRETYYKADVNPAEDVLAEQEKIESADAVVFIYPVFWTEAPAKLVGWFDRVWTSGYAYAPEPSMKKLSKALCIACAGKSMQSLIETGEIQAMETVMLGDRIRDRAASRQMIVYDNITHWNERLRELEAPKHIEDAYRQGLDFFGCND